MSKNSLNSTIQIQDDISAEVLYDRIAKYLRVRWIFLSILSVSGLITQYISERFTGTILKNIIVSIGVLLLNGIFAFTLSKITKNVINLKRLAIAVILADIFASAFLVFNNGGIEARTIIVFAIPMVAAGAFFKSKTVYGLALLASLLYDGILIFDYLELIPRVVINAPAIHNSFGSVLVATIFYPATFFMVAFVSDYVLSLLSEREMQLKESALKLNSAQKIANIGSWEWDVRTNKVSWSDQLFRIYGLKPGERKINFGFFLTCVHSSDRKRVKAIIKNASETQEPFSFEHRIVLPNGDIRKISAQGEVIADQDGQTIKMLGTGQDITTQAKNKDELMERSKEMEKMNALMINRELKMIELKQKIKEMKK